MKLTKILFFLLPLLLSAWACTLTARPTPTPPPQGGAAAMDAPLNFGGVAQVAPSGDFTKPTQTNPPPAPTNAPQVCQVKTGLSEGRLNLRACGGMDCPILATVNEGETLTQAQTVNGWLEVTTAGGLTGWVNSKFINCTNEVTK